MLGDIAQQVGGGACPCGIPCSAWTAIRTPNAEPSPKDSALLSKADVVVVNGLGLEGWLDRLIKASPGFNGELVVASKGVKTHTP
ncbi:zinc ABC transporter substrate-binding protein [Klebsiella pneumoniae]|nr:zinc ABC transporter substrate-binding protein [Klebsiella pneumoniae]